MDVGYGKLVTVLTFETRGLTLEREMWWLRKLTEDAPKTHLLYLTIRPLSHSWFSMVLKWCWCSYRFWEKNEDIINVAGAEVKIPQDAVHQALKGGAQIFQAKAEVVEGAGAKRYNNCRLWNILWVERNLVVLLQEIQLAEDSSTMEIGGHSEPCWTKDNGQVQWSY